MNKIWQPPYLPPSSTPSSPSSRPVQLSPFQQPTTITTRSTYLPDLPLRLWDFDEYKILTLISVTNLIGILLLKSGFDHIFKRGRWKERQRKFWTRKNYISHWRDMSTPFLLPPSCRHTCHRLNPVQLTCCHLPNSHHHVRSDYISYPNIYLKPLDFNEPQTQTLTPISNNNLNNLRMKLDLRWLLRSHRT
jgi:hypothetical protein